MCGGEGHGDGESATGGVFGSDGAAHGVDEAFGDGESEAETCAGVPGGVAVEGGEEGVGRSLGHAAAVVDDAEFDGVFVLAGADGDGRFVGAEGSSRDGLAVAEGVVDQVGDDAFEEAGVGRHGW